MKNYGLVFKSKWRCSEQANGGGVGSGVWRFAEDIPLGDQIDCQQTKVGCVTTARLRQFYSQPVHSAESISDIFSN